MGVLPVLLASVLVVNLALLLWLALFRRSGFSQDGVIKGLADQNADLREALTRQFALATADMASRLEQTKGDLRQQVADRLGDGFSGVRATVEEQMKAGRREQSERLLETRGELTSSLALTTASLKTDFDRLNQQTAESLDSIRERVDAKLLAITEQVQVEARSESEGGLCAI